VAELALRQRAEAGQSGPARRAVRTPDAYFHLRCLGLPAQDLTTVHRDDDPQMSCVERGEEGSYALWDAHPYCTLRNQGTGATTRTHPPPIDVSRGRAGRCEVGIHARCKRWLHQRRATPNAIISSLWWVEVEVLAAAA